MRQFAIIPMEILETPITVIGAGAIGSHTVKALAQMGFTDITVYDDDTVELENLNSKGYPISALGKPKVEALARIVHEYTETEIKTVNARYAGGIFRGIVVSAVDNMATRRLLWEAHAAKGLQTIAIVDPRMGAEMAMLYTMRPMEPRDQETYVKTLYSDAEALQEPCTAKSTIYTALLLSGHVVKAIKDLLTDSLRYPRIVAWNIRENDYELFPLVAEEPIARAV